MSNQDKAKVLRSTSYVFAIVAIGAALFASWKLLFVAIFSGLFCLGLEWHFDREE